MPGMGGAPQSGNSVIVSAFHAELFHQLLVVLLIGAVCAIAFNVIRTVQYRKLTAQGGATAVVTTDATARAGRPEGPADWLRQPLDPRRPPATAIGDAPGAPVERDPTLGRGVAAVGPARRQFGREHLVQPSDPGGVVSGMDPARSRSLADRGPPRPLVAVGRGGQRRLGPGGVGIRRGVRRHLCPRGDVVVRHAGGGAVLLRRRTPGGAARARLHDPAPRAPAS